MSLVVNRVGQKDGTGDSDALFLKVFSGEVLTAFRETNVFLSRHMVRSISSGKSAQWLLTQKELCKNLSNSGNALSGVIPSQARAVCREGVTTKLRPQAGSKREVFH